MPMPKIIQASTQKHLPVANIVEDIILLKDGGATLVLESSSLNFSLLSEKEQDAIIAAYAALLNSFSFPVQILIRSQKKDISDYLAYLEKKQQEQKNEKLTRMMTRYREFVAQTVKKRNVLEKNFYLLIPFSALELGVAKSALAVLRKQKQLPYPRSYVVKKAKTVLYPKRDHLIRQAARIGLRLRQLNTAELVELLFKVYNPGQSLPALLEPEIRKVIAQKEQQAYEQSQR